MLFIQDPIELARNREYDKALVILENASTELDDYESIFYKAICQHALLKKDDCIANCYLLLEGIDVPKRYRAMAQLMINDITPLEEDSLDEISRLMKDASRRLDLGQAGKITRKVEKDIVDKLDKLIEQAEEQLRQQQAAESQENSQQKGQGEKSNPQGLEQSKIKDDKGPGNIDQKNLDRGVGWGNLPQKDREQALQRMNDMLPSHYRDVIEAYFRNLAK